MNPINPTLQNGNSQSVKRSFAAALALFGIIFGALAVSQGAPFTPGNVVVYRIGNGTTEILANTGNSIFLDEFSPAGTLVQSIAIPSSGSNAVIASGTSTLEGMLSRSGDGQLLVVTGYNTAVPYGSSISGSASATVNRAVAIVNAAGAVASTTKLSDWATANNPRSAVTNDGTQLWLGGAVGGVRYVSSVAATTGTQINTPATLLNIRQMAIFDGQLYATTNSTAGSNTTSIGTVGSGLPTTSAAYTTLSGIAPAGTITGTSRYAFFFADLSAGLAGVDTLYIADDGALALSKYSRVASNWVLNNTIGADADDYRGITGAVNGSTVTLFATRKGGASNTGGGELVKIIDASGYNASISASPTVLANAIVGIATAPNTSFRGVAIAPGNVVLLPGVNLSVSASTGTEAGATAITVTATASAAVTSDQTVSLAVSGTGITVGDYTLSNTTITILSGATTGTVTFTIVDDVAVEDTETATLTISGPSAGITLGATTTHNIVITDNDLPLVSPTITVQPTPSQSLAYNATATLTAAATGNPTPTYQWYQGNSGDTSTPVGTASSSFTTPALTANTSYWVRASNSQGSADSNTAAITVTLSNVSSLSALSLSSGTLAPVFASGTLIYTAAVSNATSSVTVTPAKSNTYATIEARVNGGAYASVTSGSPSSTLALDVGSNTVDVKITAQNGEATSTYTVTVTRRAPNLATGAIAFTGFNADGNDDIAFVALTAIPGNVVIYFTDNEWNGSPIGSGGNFVDFNESEWMWTAPADGVAAGTVVTINNISTTTATLVGTVAFTDSANRGLGTSGDAVYAFQGSSHSAEVFLAEIGSDAAASIANTGLTTGSTAVVLSSSSDGARYRGSRSNQATFTGYLSLIGNVAANWDDIASGDGATYLPFNTAAFTLSSGPASVNLSVSANIGTEAASTVITVTATASAAVTGDQTLSLAVTGTGITAGDYTLSNATVTILNGATNGTVTFTVADDAIAEGTETATLTISSPSAGLTLGSTTAQNVAITDNDPASSGPYTNANRDILAANTSTWSPAGVTVNGTTFVNLGLQGVGRLPANSIDSDTGETLGSISDMQISEWRKNSDGSYSGTFNFLPDRGYNSGAVYSNYAARLNNFDFTFTPYTSSAITGSQNQIAMTFTGSERFTYDHDANSGTAAVYTTGLNTTGTGTLFGTTVPTASGNTTQSDGTVNNRLTLDSEGLILDKRTGKVGAGWIGDEYGASVYHFNSAKQIDGQLILPAALIPRKPAGSTNFNGIPDNGRRDNQGIEGIAQSPDGRRLFVLMQSATIQDSGSGNQGRSNTRLLVYDISSTDTPSDPIDQYVIRLPRVDTNDDLAVDRTAAQSAIISLNDQQLLILSRDGNGRGASGAPIFKSVLLADLSTATDIDGTYDAEAAEVSPGGTLSGLITPLNWTEALNLIGKLDLSVTEVEQFGLNLNAAPGDSSSICEKWEALSLVSANDLAFPNDYFLFVGNDNDFVTSSIKYIDAAGTVQTAVGALENDTVVLAFRVRMTGTFNQAPIVPNSLVGQTAVASTAFSYTFAANSFADPESSTLSYVATKLDDSALPTWLSFNPATRSFSGTPTGADVGSLLVKVTATDNGSPALATSTCFTITVGPALLTPVETWRQLYFSTTANSGLMADDGDFDGDGVLNLIEYALGSNPTLTSGVEAQAALPVGVLNGSGNPLLSDRYVLSFTINSPAPTDLTYTVEAGDDLENWTPIAQSTGDSTWTWLAGGASHIVVGTPSAGRVTIKVGDMVPRAGNPKRVMRLKASK